MGRELDTNFFNLSNSLELSHYLWGKTLIGALDTSLSSEIIEQRLNESENFVKNLTNHMSGGLYNLYWALLKLFTSTTEPQTSACDCNNLFRQNIIENSWKTDTQVGIQVA